MAHFDGKEGSAIMSTYTLSRIVCITEKCDFCTGNYLGSTKCHCEEKFTYYMTRIQLTTPANFTEKVKDKARSTGKGKHSDPIIFNVTVEPMHECVNNKGATQSDFPIPTEIELGDEKKTPVIQFNMVCDNQTLSDEYLAWADTVIPVLLNIIDPRGHVETFCKQLIGKKKLARGRVPDRKEYEEKIRTLKKELDANAQRRMEGVYSSGLVGMEIITRFVDIILKVMIDPLFASDEKKPCPHVKSRVERKTRA